MTMSMAAKAAWPILWTECDDHGIFEWKPIVLKARIFPADNVDFDSLLTEWIALNCVQKFECNGRHYGIVRNFGAYQRPKHPSYRHPFPVELEEYAGIKNVDSDSAPALGGEVGVKTTENPPQMKEEEGEERKDANASSAVGKPTRSDRDEIFERFWKSYPSRGDRANPKSPARKVFDALIRQGIDPESIIAGLLRGAGYDRQKVGTEYIPQAVKWLRDRRWEDVPPLIQPQSIDWEKHVQRYRAAGYWPIGIGNDPDSFSCRAPPEILARYGYSTPTEHAA